MTALLLDNNGFLKDHTQWNTTVAEKFAQQESLILNDHHWLVIHYVRAFYVDLKYMPTQRHIVKMLKEKCGETQGTSLYLQQLFPKGPRQIALISGLPKPTRCV